MNMRPTLEIISENEREGNDYAQLTVRCDWCGERIDREKYYEIDGQQICSICIEDCAKQND